MDGIVVPRPPYVELILARKSEEDSSSYHAWSVGRKRFYFKTMVLHWISGTTCEVDRGNLMPAQ